ncbi:PA2169 family four-helix-bundle protein [Frateuria aurantia]|uniref:PA2169 family four-helix-bundle protein n=1 Tax=Frateuria aurantia TaxID=81475 RepID=UPI0002E3DCB9|nr:PA2169 family four-helix-bundle protein [Frateuria aurantia]
MARAPNQLINDLIRYGIDDRDLYGVAADKVREPGLRQVLHENCLALAAVVTDLQNLVRASGARPARHGTLRGWIQRQLGAWLARRGGGDHVWIDLLAQSEAGYRHMFESGLDHMPQEVRPVLQRQQPRLRELQADMCSLSQGERARH